MKSKIVLIGAVTAGIMIAVSAALIAGQVSLPNNFTAGTPAKASEVNANFNAVAGAVNDNATRITTIESNINGGNLVLTPSTATTGNILKGVDRFLHNFGSDNTFLGVNAGNFTMTGTFNTASGASALSSNTTGNSNTASGVTALLSNTTGFSNTAVGASALASNTTGFSNTASGLSALFSNTTGNSNTASGAVALFSNTTGSSNTASGVSALQNNTTGISNTASGVSALQNNTTGISNTASGLNALQNNTTGGGNTASGLNALRNNTTGNSNTAIGLLAGVNLTTGGNNIVIGNVGVADESNTIRIGIGQSRAFIAGIRGVTTAGAAIPVLVDVNGQLGTVSSSRRVKDDIAEMGAASSLLMQLRPVTFHYKSDKDPNGRTLQYGLIAEEVEKVAPGLVARSADGKIETVYYQFLAPMLLNEVQKQQHTIEAQAAEIARQRQEIAQLKQQTARLETLEQKSARMAAALERLERAEKLAMANR